MNKRTSLTALALAVAGVAIAAPLTPAEALQRAKGNGPAKAASLLGSQTQLCFTSKTMQGTTAAYVFAKPGQPGFTIVSADDIAMPVLGYSDTEVFDKDNMSPSTKWWLSEYGRQIEYAAAHGTTEFRAPAAPADMKPVGPLVKTKWNQSAPYNLYTPKISDVNTPVGCVATSFGQAMKYFNYPESGEGKKTYKWGTRNLSIDFSRTKFEWDNMLDVYTGDYTEDQAKAVSTLMRAVGYSVEMNYTANGSGAASYLIVRALVDYFKYDKSVDYYTRLNYSDDEWSRMIYNNLVNCGPVIYNGTSPLDGGHSFICDGYDGKGYFHINWGWGGVSDGYYALTALTPEIQGIGGSMGGFNYSQDAVLGMKIPDADSPAEHPSGRVMQNGYTIATLNGKNLTLSVGGMSPSGWGNVGAYDISAYPGVIIEPVDGGEQIDVKGFINPGKMNFTLGPGHLFNTTVTGGGASAQLDVELPADLKDGRYRVYTAFQDYRLENAQWQIVDPFYGYANYCILTVKDGSYSVEDVLPVYMKYDKMVLDSPLYYGRNVKIDAQITNPSDLQLMECISPVLLKGDAIHFKADAFLVAVDPGKTQEFTWVFKFFPTSSANYSDPSEYTLAIFDEDRHQIIARFGTVTMNSLTGSTTVKLDDLSIEGAERKSVEIDGSAYNNVYIVTDPHDFKVNFDYSVSRGYLDSGVLLGIYRRLGSNAVYQSVFDPLYNERPFMTAGDSKEMTIPVDFTDAEPNVLYYIRAQYVRNDNYNYLGQIMFTLDTTGVGEIETENGSSAEYFNLQGVRVDNPVKGQVLIERRNGKTRKVVY